MQAPSNPTTLRDALCNEKRYMPTHALNGRCSMHGSLGLFFSSLNVVLAAVILGLDIWGIRRFTTRLVVKNLKRGLLVAILLFLYFLTTGLIAVDILPSNSPVDDVLGTILVLSLVYVAYGYVTDWRKLQHVSLS